MADLSVKGICRRFLGLSGALAVRTDLFAGVSGTVTLRSRLTSMSSLAVKSSILDCGTSIEQNYTQIWTHIIVRLKLVGHDVDNLPTPLERWKDYWKMGIEGIWNRQIPASFPAGAFHKSMGTSQEFWKEIQEDTVRQSGDPKYWTKHWACKRNGEASCRLIFELQWVEANEDHLIDVGNIVSKGGSDERGWRLLPTGEGLTLTGAAHEFGHMLGLSHDRLAPNGCEVETTEKGNFFSENPNLDSFPWARTVMCAISICGQLPERSVKQFADNIGSAIQLISD